MLRLAEFDAANNPQRAALLKRAAQQSATRLTRNQLVEVSRLLTPPAQLQRAIEDQQAVLKDMRELLELLLTENRSDRLKRERERIREYIKEVERLIRLERSLKAETETGHELKPLANKQAEIAERAGELSDRIRADAGLPPREQDATEPGRAQEDRKPAQESELENSRDPAESNGDRQEPSPDGQTPPTDPSQQNPSQQNPSQQNPSQQNPSQQDPSQQDPSQQAQPSSEQQPDPPDAPGQQRLESARQRMKQAQQRLQAADRQQAVQQQEQARRELELAKAELERILRQLREEEVERVLASLEERFRRMLEAQLSVYEATQQLDGLSANERGREAEIEASKLSFQETKLVLDTDKALTLLREEGSSVAFPESVEQMRDDMAEVAERLAELRVGLVTQTAEESIIDALQEMIAALQQAQDKLEEQRQQPPALPPAGQQGEMPLVDKLAELKMIRALQLRVNKRTERCAELLEDADDPVGQTADQDLRNVLSTLSARQRRIYEVTRNIVMGKNQ